MENIQKNSIEGKFFWRLTFDLGMSKIVDSGSLSDDSYYIAMQALGSSLKDLA